MSQLAVDIEIMKIMPQPLHILQCERAVTINLQWHESSLPAKFTIEFFTVYTKLAEMALLASKDLTTAKNVTST